MTYSTLQRQSNRQAAWHVLQISGPLDVEFVSAMSELAPTIGWEPERTLLPSSLQGNASAISRQKGKAAMRSFPLMRGYAKPPISWIARTGPNVVRHLGGYARTSQDVLVCTVPYFAPVAELWPGPVVYWLTDRISHYPSSRGIDVEALDRRMCKVATLLCPNSARLRDYLMAQGGHPDKILVVPNATRKDNLQSSVPTRKADLPESARHLKNPIAGVIGNLAGNLDWVLLDEATSRTPGVQWLFVGPTDMVIPEVDHRNARERVMARSNALFVGAQPYGDLVHYARAFDVAVLPYRKCEPTYSGSSTRFYEHLAACRPMLATRGFEELLHKEPYLQLVSTADDIIESLYRLGVCNYDDGYLGLRWKASQTETWQARTSAMFERLQSELGKANADYQMKPTEMPAERFVFETMQSAG